ncbi:MAG: hypothetical protein SGI74_10430 [Oligoflexia bacterium]|nr:hypothetical protein [Oligoflexia bacterium]
MQRRPRNNIIIVFLVLTLSLPAFGYYSTFDTGEIVRPDQNQVGFETQFIMTSPTATNFMAHYDLGASESVNYKFLLGGGTRTVQAGGFIKYIPLPDYKYQPAVGAIAGVIYANHQGSQALGLRFHPLISKRLNAEEFGIFTPYVSTPFGITFASLQTSYPSQFVLGSSWTMNNEDTAFRVIAEYGINMNAAFNYLTIGFTLPIDGTSTISDTN